MVKTEKDIIFMEWEGQKLTSAKRIAEFYSTGEPDIVKKIKPYIQKGMQKVKVIKFTPEQIKANRDEFYPVLPKDSPVPHLGINLINVEDVEKIAYYFTFILKQYEDQTYKKDRFKSNRTLFEELKLELERNKKRLTTEEFKAMLSYLSRLETGQPKVYALRHASEKFEVKQVRIKEIFKELELHIDYVNMPRKLGR